MQYKLSREKTIHSVFNFIMDMTIVFMNDIMSGDYNIDTLENKYFGRNMCDILWDAVLANLKHCVKNGNVMIIDADAACRAANLARMITVFINNRDCHSKE